LPQRDLTDVVELPAPPGRYERLTLLLDKVTGLPESGPDWIELARSGFAARDIVVLHLMRDRRQYREIFPLRVDTVNHTVTVRAARLSACFACTPGSGFPSSPTRRRGSSARRT